MFRDRGGSSPAQLDPVVSLDGGRVTEAAIALGLGGGSADRFRVGIGVGAVGLVLNLIVADEWWLIT